MDICCLTCICLWQISQIQTFLFKVVGPGLVSTSPAFVSSSASHPPGPHGRHAQKRKSGPHCWGRGGSTQFAQQLKSAVTAPPLVGCVVWSHHMVTNSIRHKHQQTTDNTKHRTHNSNWVHNRHKHTTSTRRNTHTTYKGTPPTTCITHKTKITTPNTPTTLHHNTTNNTQT